MSAAGWALALYGVYGLLAFGLRGVIQRRRTGDAGFRGFSGAFGSPEWFAGVLFALAIVAGAFGPIADLAGWLDPVSDFGGAASVGGVLATVGIAATVAAQFAMGDSWRIGVQQDERTDLVTGGVFGVVRNPIFTAMIVTACGLAAMTPNLASIAGFVGLIIGLELHVRLVEEPYLAKVHGAPYRRYLTQVGRFIPGVGRARTPTGPGVHS